MKKMIQHIYLVRHGEVENPKHIIYGYLPVKLTKKGERQIRQAGRFLKNKNISAIFASPMKRTQQTAKILSQVVSKGKIKVKTEKDLRESGFSYKFQGLTQKEVQRKYPKQWFIFRRQPAKSRAGETFAKMAERVLNVIKKEIKKIPARIWFLFRTKTRLRRR